MQDISKEDYAFVIEQRSNYSEEIYYISMEDALKLARKSNNLVFIYYGKYRYHYCNGKPLLSIIEYGDSELSKSINLLENKL